jgi:hypothetical protein
MPNLRISKYNNNKLTKWKGNFVEPVRADLRRR